jgi:hypothetical protein
MAFILSPIIGERIGEWLALAEASGVIDAKDFIALGVLGDAVV